MQQRTVIAAALACGPELIIADEPTTALDVTIQMQILNLLKEAQKTLGSSILYISHDLANVARICERVMIMYAGEIVESASTRDLFREPLHPYTQGLLSCIPAIGGQCRGLLVHHPGHAAPSGQVPAGLPLRPSLSEGNGRSARRSVRSCEAYGVARFAACSTTPRVAASPRATASPKVTEDL